MQVWKELRTRWMYWRYRYITRNRQRMVARWSYRRSQPALRHHYHPRGQSEYTTGRQSNRPRQTWLVLVVTVLAIATFQYLAGRYGLARDLIFLVDVGILILAYVAWRQVTLLTR